MAESNQLGLNSFEVILLGTGGGYGESVVVRLGNHNWIVIDSCEDPVHDQCLPLEYLKSREVNLSRDVKLIICSHWHDDHIRGLDALLRECTAASFSFAITADKEKFLQFIGFDSRNDKQYSGSTNMLRSCLDILQNRNGTVKNAMQDRLLLSIEENEIDSKVYSISPSDETLKQFGIELSDLLKISNDSNRKILCSYPNRYSVVIVVSVNEHYAMLGADFENDTKHAWKVLLDSSESIKNKLFSVVKIPHHGSITAYEEDLWSKHSEKSVIGQISPFVNGSTMLPTKDMISLYSQKTSNLYITSYQSRMSVSKKRGKSIMKAIEKLNPSIREINYEYGSINCTLNVSVPQDNWNTILCGSAHIIDRFCMGQS